MIRSVCLVTLAVASCTPPPAPPVAPPAAPSAPAAPPVASVPTTPPEPTPPTLRLPAGARPTHHTVELTIDPASEDFAGTITPELDRAAPTPVLRVHGHQLPTHEP